MLIGESLTYSINSIGFSDSYIVKIYLLTEVEGSHIAEHLNTILSANPSISKLIIISRQTSLRFDLSVKINAFNG